MEQLELPFKDGLPRNEKLANKKEFAGKFGDRIEKNFHVISRKPFYWNGSIAKEYSLEDDEGHVYKFNLWNESKFLQKNFKAKCTVKKLYWGKEGIATTVVERMKIIYE